MASNQCIGWGSWHLSRISQLWQWRHQRLVSGYRYQPWQLAVLAAAGVSYHNQQPASYGSLQLSISLSAYHVYRISYLIILASRNVRDWRKAMLYQLAASA